MSERPKTDEEKQAYVDEVIRGAAQQAIESLRAQRDALVTKVAQQERVIGNLKAELRKLHRREHELQASERAF